MKELIEFRLNEEYADQFVGPDRGDRLGASVRLIRLPVNDPLISVIQARQQVADDDESVDSVYSTAYPIRNYTKREVGDAKILQLRASTFFEPAGEQVGTKYDDEHACTFCGSEQIGDLILRAGSVPRHSAHVAQTIADELIVSQAFIDVYHAIGGRGAEFAPVKTSKGSIINGWRQPRFVGKRVCIHARTRFGATVFDPDEKGEYRCPLGHALGLNQLSQLVVHAPDFPFDFARTDKLVGARMGLLRPEPMYLISARLYQACLTLPGRKLKVEPVEIVEQAPANEVRRG
jgi:hypothetical protein